MSAQRAAVGFDIIIFHTLIWPRALSDPEPVEGESKGRGAVSFDEIFLWHELIITPFEKQKSPALANEASRLICGLFRTGYILCDRHRFCRDFRS